MHVNALPCLSVDPPAQNAAARKDQGVDTIGIYNGQLEIYVKGRR
jgi:hypothetical protein